ncbi:uncharacterized protein LOC116927587, partial [Daphnia magna]|uniref:uncharacterized protein LOC116927587 n=1 Tax=Daphnia magna TaxID=35525 RepID=UPI001E1BCC5F
HENKEYYNNITFCWFVRLLGLSCSHLMFVDDFSSAKSKQTKIPTNNKTKEMTKKEKKAMRWIYCNQLCDGVVCVQDSSISKAFTWATLFCNFVIQRFCFSFFVISVLWMDEFHLYAFSLLLLLLIFTFTISNISSETGAQYWPFCLRIINHLVRKWRGKRLGIME